MSDFPDTACDVVSRASGPIRYSFCSLVTRPGQYGDMVESFRARGFGGDDCEFLYADNRVNNSCDGYRGLNRLINAARGTYVILIHQDILAIDDRAQLDAVLEALTQQDPDWAVAGNAGTQAKKMSFRRMTSTMGYNERIGDLPGQVDTLDENFLVLRKDALVGFSHDLAGFHFYGTDLVQQARLQGRSAYVIDYHLEHLGLTEIDAGFMQAMDDFAAKYQNALAAPNLRALLNARQRFNNHARTGSKPP